MFNSLMCPACRSEKLIRSDTVTKGEGAICPSCKSTFRSLLTNNRILDLRVDSAAETLLDVDSYDLAHGIGSDEASRQIYKYYESMLIELNANLLGRVLEIASGSGYLSMGLVNHSKFSSICLSDISPRFMTMLDGKLSADSRRARAVDTVLFDANYIPFADCLFDVVIGNSCLHHFATFESTLESAFRVLSPGGIAVFGEPVMDTYVFSCTAAQLIVEACARMSDHPLATYDLNIMNAISNLADLKMRNLKSDRTKLEDVEDKFVFPISHMRRVSERTGYSYFHCISPVVDDFADCIKREVARVFVQQSIDIKKLDYFDFIFKGLGKIYGSAMKDDLKANFSFFAFVK